MTTKNQHIACDKAICNLPDLSLKKETTDFFYAVCGYTPIPSISRLLASKTEGFFSDKYQVN